MGLNGDQLKRLRTTAGLTQQQVAQMAGVSQAHIAKIENGAVDPRLSTVNKILQVLTEGEGRKCKEIMTRNVMFAKPNDRILKISRVMMEHGISQLPVMWNTKVIGTVTEESIIRNLHVNIAHETVEKIMDPPLPSVPEDTPINTIRLLLEDHPGVLVVRKGDVAGMITRSDVLKTVAR